MMQRGEKLHADIFYLPPPPVELGVTVTLPEFGLHGWPVPSLGAGACVFLLLEPRVVPDFPLLRFFQSVEFKHRDDVKIFFFFLESPTFCTEILDARVCLPPRGGRQLTFAQKRGCFKISGPSIIHMDKWRFLNIEADFQLFGGSKALRDYTVLHDLIFFFLAAVCKQASSSGGSS